MPPSHNQKLIFCESWTRRQDLKITPHKIHQVTLNLYLGGSANLCRQVIKNYILVQEVSFRHYYSVSEANRI